MSFLKKYKLHFLILLLGVLWVFVFDYITQMRSQGVMHSDSFNYQEAAKNLYLSFSGHIYRPILMALITGIPYLFGGSDQSVFVFSFYTNLFCWLATLVLFFEIVKEWCNPKMAFIFTVLVIFIIGNTVHVFHLLTETIYQFLMVLVFYLLQRYYKTTQFWYLSLSISLLLLTMLIKPGSKFLAIVITLYFSKEIYKHYKDKSVLFLCGSLLALGIQYGGMKYQFGNYTISYIDSVTYYAYIGSKAMCFKFDKEYSQKDNPRADYIFSNTAIKQRQIANNDFKDQIRYNTSNLIKAYFDDVKENTVSGNSCLEEIKNYKNRSFFNATKLFLFDVSKWQNRVLTLLSLLLASLFFLKEIKNPKLLTFISFFILYTILLSGISCGQGDRFHLVVFPFALLLLAKFIAEQKMFKQFSEPLQK